MSKKPSEKLPRSYSEAIFLINSINTSSAVTDSDRFSAYIWLIKFFLDQQVGDRARSLIERAQNQLKLTPSQIETLHSLPLNHFPQTPSKINLSLRESELLQILDDGPQPPATLIKKLYGSRTPYETGLNRIKNIIYLIRKKHPFLIIWEQGLIKKGEI